MLRQPATVDYRPPSLSLDPDAIYFTLLALSCITRLRGPRRRWKMLESEASRYLSRLLNRPVVPVQTRFLEPLDTMESGFENIATEPIRFFLSPKDGVSGSS
jgi:hypothetical protein